MSVLFALLFVGCAPDRAAPDLDADAARSPYAASIVTAEMQRMVREGRFSASPLMQASLAERLHPAGIHAIDELLREERSGYWDYTQKRYLGDFLAYATIGNDPYVASSMPERTPHPLIPERGEPIDAWTIERVLTEVGITTLDPEVVLYAMHLNEVSRHNRELMMDRDYGDARWPVKSNVWMDALSGPYLPEQEARVLSYSRTRSGGVPDEVLREPGHYGIRHQVVADIEWARIAPTLGLDIPGLWTVQTFEEFQRAPLRVTAPRLEFWANIANPMWVDGAMLRIVTDMLDAIEEGGGPLELRSRTRVLGDSGLVLFHDTQVSTITADQVWQTAITEMLGGSSFPGSFHTTDAEGDELLFDLEGVGDLSRQARTPWREPDYRFHRADGEPFYLRGRPQQVGSNQNDDAYLIGHRRGYGLSLHPTGYDAPAPVEGTPWNDRIVGFRPAEGYLPAVNAGTLIDDRLWEDNDGVLWTPDGLRVSLLSHERTSPNTWQLVRDERFWFFLNHTWNDPRPDFLLDVESRTFYDLPELDVPRLRTWEVTDGVLTGTRTPEGGNSWDPAVEIEPVDLYEWADLATEAPSDHWLDAERWNGEGATPGYDARPRR